MGQGRKNVSTILTPEIALSNIILNLMRNNQGILGVITQYVANTTFYDVFSIYIYRLSGDFSPKEN